MKILYASVPQWFPVSPYLACGLLAGQAEAAGFQADTHDFNVAFFNDILTETFLRQSLRRAREFAEAPVLSCAEADRERFGTTLADTAAVRQTAVSAFLSGDAARAEETLRDIGAAVEVFRDREKFYDPEQLFRAKDVVDAALEIVSLPFAPARSRIDNYIAHPVFTDDWP